MGDTASCTAPLVLLPAELYSAILSHIPADELQRTILSLTRALPRSPIDQEALFRDIRIERAEQVIQLNRRLRLDAEAATWVKHFFLGTWNADADVLISLIKMLPQLLTLHLNIGVTFAPEHLEALFERPLSPLQSLSLRFRPYVERPSYYQFHKGSYFDGTLERLARWPANPKFTYLSIVQDPLPPKSRTVPRTGRSGALDTGSIMRSFAQPIVFFSLGPLKALSTSLAALHITHLRIRVPEGSVHEHILIPGSFPALTFLDISTTKIPERVLQHILQCHVRLEHLILDDCLGGAAMWALAGDMWWTQLGRACMRSALGRAEDLEKEYNEATSNPLPEEREQASVFKAAKRGRRGLAISTISLRDKSKPKPPSMSTTIATPSTSAPSSTSVFRPITSVRPSDSSPSPHIRIVPSYPRLLTLSTGSTASPPTPTQCAEWTLAFQKSWMDGLKSIRAKRERMRTAANAEAAQARASSSSEKNGKEKGKSKERTVLMVEDAEFDIEAAESGERNLGDALPALEEEFNTSASNVTIAGPDDADSKITTSRDRLDRTAALPLPPILCVAAPNRNQGQESTVDNGAGNGVLHSYGCGHSVWDTQWSQ
ncbi:hypothetical protein BOTBODRAFT_171882 [Botryobasidium botryosum FD-172 SS1]|uniref:F-box domain-containing protein n=1 Tax=Botryobasidium botryosum (strain FD-172 SS1) TaxID=930990 RepID=A0A067N245_BOTB1|nr:hypothetical protein BOTBODRAFT_171882 [Botryobasidium botryosum FD-172 SS1]